MRRGEERRKEEARVEERSGREREREKESFIHWITLNMVTRIGAALDW